MASFTINRLISFDNQSYFGKFLQKRVMGSSNSYNHHLTKDAKAFIIGQPGLLHLKGRVKL
jgi:hypothetical protein